MKKFWDRMVFGVLVLLTVFIAKEAKANDVHSNVVISAEWYFPMTRKVASFKVYLDGTVVRGRDSFVVSTQLLHSVCGELREIGFFDIQEHALRKKLDDVQQATGRHLGTHDYETTTLNVSYQGRSNEITWEAIVSYADTYPEIPEFKTVSGAFGMVHTNFASSRYRP